MFSNLPQGSVQSSFMTYLNQNGWWPIEEIIFICSNPRLTLPNENGRNTF